MKSKWKRIFVSFLALLLIGNIITPTVFAEGNEVNIETAEVNAEAMETETDVTENEVISEQENVETKEMKDENVMEENYSVNSLLDNLEETENSSQISTFSQVNSITVQAGELITDKLNALGNDVGELTIILEGNTGDTTPVIIPSDKGITKVIITSSGADYMIGNPQQKVFANGVPMIFEHGDVYSLYGGGLNTSVNSTNLVVKGGKYTTVIVGGGQAITADAKVNGNTSLTISEANIVVGQIYSGGHSYWGDNLSHNVSVNDTFLLIENSTVRADMICGGAFVNSKGIGTVEKATILVKGSHLELGDGLFGGSIADGNYNDPVDTNASVKTIDMQITDSEISRYLLGNGKMSKGVIYGGSFSTYNAILDNESINILIKDSEICEVVTGGNYNGKHNINIGEITLTMDSVIAKPGGLFSANTVTLGSLGFPSTDGTMKLETGSVSFIVEKYLTFVDADGNETVGYIFPAGYNHNGKGEQAVEEQVITISGSTQIASADYDNEMNILYLAPSGFEFVTETAEDGTISIVMQGILGFEANAKLEALFDSEGTINDSVDQNQINEAQEAINQLPGGDLRNELQARLDAALAQLNSRTYEIIKEFATFTGSGTVFVKINVPVNMFSKVYVDGAELNSSNYIITEGSTIVTLQENYLKTLENGTYQVEVEFTSGVKVDATLLVNVETVTIPDEGGIAPTNPTNNAAVTQTDVTKKNAIKTGDTTDIQLLFLALFVSIGLAGASGIAIKKRRRLK